MKAAVFFDMDGVLLRGESQFSFLLWCLRYGVAPQFRALPVVVQYASYLAGFSRDALKLRRSGFNLLRGVAVEKLEHSASKFLHENLARRFRKQTTSLVEAHRKQGHFIVLVTSACEPVAMPVAAKLNCDATIATRLLANHNCYTGERDLPEPYGVGKRLLVEKFCEKHFFSPSECFAYADHHTDVPLLEFVGHPVAANPTRKLESIARAQNWPIVDLDSPTMPAVNFQKIIRSC